jgi:SAM-dependent methyltransferase
MDDRKTQAYFDSHTPEWRSDRYLPMLELIDKHHTPGSSLLDIGCGTGNILQFIRQHTQVADLAGLDITQNYLDQAKANVDCQTILGSVLDDQLVQRVGPRYDFAVMGAVLHHLVGNTRRQSRANAQRAVRNALNLLKPGGILLIYEPAHYPRAFMSGVFWIKKLCSLLTSSRIELFSKWFNLGLPVVSYFTNEQLEQMFRECGAQIVDKKILDRKKLGMGIWRTSSTFALRSTKTS